MTGGYRKETVVAGSQECWRAKAWEIQRDCARLDKEIVRMRTAILAFLMADAGHDVTERIQARRVLEQIVRPK